MQPRVMRQPPPREGVPAFRATRSDARIRDDVCEAMTHEGWLDPSDLEVRVEQQRVTIEGTVAEVQWVNPLRVLSDNPNPGMGIRFIDLTNESRERLIDAVRTIAYVHASSTN